MYGPIGEWHQEPPRRAMPPSRYPRMRSRSPIREPVDRYPYPEPPVNSPFRPQVKLPYRGERPDIDGIPRYRSGGFGSVDRRAGFRNFPDEEYRSPARPDLPREPHVREREPSLTRYPNRPDGDRHSPRYGRPFPDERPDFRPRGMPVRDDEYYFGDEGRRNGYPPVRRPGPIDEPRFYPREDYPPFERPKEFGQRAPVEPPRRRSPEPRYGFMPPKPAYPPRGSWPRGPSPTRWR